MHFAQDTWSGRICLVLGLILLVWGACREPMLPTRPVVVAAPAEVEEVKNVAAGDDDGGDDALVIVRHEEKTGK